MQQTVVLIVALQLLGSVVVNGELTSSSKQLLLDLNNIYRASNVKEATRILDWSTELEGKVKEYVTGCDAVEPQAGWLQFYNTSSLPDDESRFEYVFEQWISKDEYRQQILSRHSTHVGCAELFCERLPVTVNSNTPSALFIVCAYNPRYFMGNDNSKEICSKEDDVANCPSDAKNCISFPEERRSQLKFDPGSLSMICSSSPNYPILPVDPETTPPPAVTRRVTRISPTIGSIRGGQRITVFGEGFSASNFDGANEVYFVRGSERIPCEVTDYSSSSTQIVCVTGSSPIETGDAYYNLEVYVTIEGKRERASTDSCSNCQYRYNYGYWTSIIRDFEPSALTFGDTLTTSGRLFANTFADISDSESDEANFDHFTRLLVGGAPCDHMPTNDSNYIAEIDENGVNGRIECLPTAGYFTGAMNVTFFLETRGATALDPNYYLVNYDNKFQPYTVVTHADILSVSPRAGSKAGGTRISITLNTPLVNYTDLDDVVVRVGGVPCVDLELIGSYDNYSVITCTTGPQPPSTAYYPGGRGLLREVWEDGDRSLSNLITLPRASQAATHDRAFLHSDYVSDFGELYNLGQRLSGFFVPPITSLYTFNVRSDDGSALYLSPNSSSEDIEDHLIAIAPFFSQNSWNHFDTQVSDPILLEEGKHYYFMMVGNQGGGPWSIAFGAKVHNLTYNSPPYVGDSGQQLVTVTSTVDKEEHTIHLEARPLVQTITIIDTNSLEDNSTVFCPIPLSLSTVNLTISRDMLPEVLEDRLNSEELVQSVGKVEVRKDYYDGDSLMLGNLLDVKFTIIFLTGPDVGMSQIPQLSLRSDTDVLSCDHTPADANATSQEYTVSASVDIVQSLSYPSDFRVGFVLPTQPPRHTPSLLLNVTKEQLHDEISSLFEWECETDVETLTEQDRVSYRSSLEESSESNRVNDTSFCGHYSEQNPGNVWRSSWFGNVELNPDQYRYMCFAYKGSLPNFRVISSFTDVITEVQEGNSVPVQFADAKTNINFRINDCSSYPFREGVNFASDGWSDYRCVNVRDCLLEVFPNSRDHRINRVFFNQQSQFWVDEFVIASTEVSFTRSTTVEPIRPNGVSVKYVEVIDDSEDLPVLRTTAKQGSTDYTMIVSTFRVIYTVRDCGYGIEPIVGNYGNQDPVFIEQTSRGSPPVTGTFDLKISGKVIKDIPADVDATTLEMLLEANLQNEGGFAVSSVSDDCAGYSWQINWETRGGDVEQIVADTNNLKGDGPNITVTTLLAGGTWLRPIGGEMLRLPMEEPQVEVILDGTPSSCRGQECSFSYEDSATPTITSVFPLEGQGGSDITIYGVGFSDDMSTTAVTVGNAPCTLVSANSTQITCMLSNHPAGYYDISVLIEGMGVSVSTNDTCFHYLLSIDTVSPPTGGVGGGAPIQISGNGFLEFTPLPADRLDTPFSFLPWFRYGFGIPAAASLEDLRVCPMYWKMLSEQIDQYSAESVSEIISRVREFISDQERNGMETMDGRFPFLDCADDNCTSFDSDFPIIEDGRFIYSHLVIHLLNLYYHLPSSALLNGVPCVIVESTVEMITCIPLASLPSDVNITVRVFTETASLPPFAYEVDVASTPLIESLDPQQGAVTGGNLLTIVGSNFGAMVAVSDVTVYIGETECVVQSVSSTEITCETGPSRPSRQAVFVSTPSGVAVLEFMDSGSGMEQEMVLFPIFEYRLVVYLSDAVASVGSVFGGTMVGIEGGVFSPDYTRVLVGGQEVELQQVTMDTIEFRTPSSSTTRTVALERSQVRVSPVTGQLSVDLFWNVEGIQIQVGDSVFWKLSDEVQDFLDLQNVEVSLELESDTLSSTLIRGEYMSAFQFTFRRVGSFVLSSVAMPGFDIKDFVVNVTGPQLSFNEVEVFVGEEKALLVEREMPQGIGKRQAVDCDVMPADNNGEFVIEYSPCLTPTVTKLEPRMGFRLQTVFTIQGTQFSTTPEYNVVTFDGYACTTLTSNETTITCIMDDVSAMPPTFTQLPISVRVVGLGDAYIVNTDESYIVLQSYITQVTPSSGSLEGGTDLFIHGDGFPTDNSSTVGVSLGGGRVCTVTSYSYKLVTCSSEASGSDEDEQVLLTLTTSSELTDTQTAICLSDNGCSFNYSDAYTPKVESVSPLSVSSTGDTTLTITGSGFTDSPSSTEITFGEVPVQISASTANTITVQFPPQPAGSYPVSVKVCADAGMCTGYARVLSLENTTVISEPDVISVSPTSGSVMGGTRLTITGRGFNVDPNEVQVLIGGSECAVESVSYSEIECVTSPREEGSYGIEVSITNLPSFPEAVTYNYSMESTPVITGISPSSGNGGTEVTLTGSGLNGGDGMAGNSNVFIGEAECVISAISDTSITCTLDNYFVGTYSVGVAIDGRGEASIDPNVTFSFILSIDSVQPSQGSLAGGSVVSIDGNGFFPADVEITVCGQPCPLASATPSVTHLECVLPAMDTTSLSSISCDLVITTMNEMETRSMAYTYLPDLTPRVVSVDRNRGGTGGGSVLLITGQGFDDMATVTIAGSVCEVSSQSETELVCTTGESGRNVRATIMVFIEGKGFAVSNVEFWYVDLWSSPFTWQDGIIPSTGDFVVVPRGQTLVLDVVTPVLGYILIQGGTLIFDPEKGDNEVELHTQGGLITSDGVFQVGTEDEPFMAKTQIVLYGHVLSTELPVYGAKTLALRRGTLDIHGRPLNITWTHLSETVEANSNEIYLQEYVDWDVGGSIVIASTSFSQRENEERVIASIAAGPDGSILTLTEPLDYQHISIQQTIAGRFIDTSAEVGYLTRNVVIRGNVNEEWLEGVPACPEEFRVGQFDVQTCFQGRFGAETINDQFGSQVMIHAAEQNQGHVTARFGYVEVTHAGQAFRLGRYPIHYHLNGDVTGSYVRGCGIHHTFNRAVTMHAVDNLLVEKNVAFNIMGHAYFLEDGIEQHNIIQDNLGVFVRASSSLLNVDITPATFWVVNPNNILRRNAAAGGTHFGFWYRLPQHPEGPSATFSLCPRKLPLEEFSDNSAHSFGWYGLWMFRQYHPTASGSCGDNTPAPAYYDRFLSWRNDKGIEFEQAGSLQIRDSIFMDNKLAGVEITDVTSIWSGENDDGPLVKDTLIVGYSDITTETGSSTCTVSGIKTPHSYFLTVSNVTFVNFDRDNCYPVTPCSFCRHPFQGGFETRFKQIEYINAGDEITRWSYFHEHAQRDLDGTLTGTGRPSVLVPFSNIYSPSLCENHAGSNTGPQDGMICEGEVEFGRIGVHDPFPSSLTSSQLELTSEYGTDQLPFEFKRFRGGPGQMAIVPLNKTFELSWVEGVNFTNITYSVTTAGFEEDDYVLFEQRYPRRLDYTNIRGVTEAVNVSVLDDPASAETGDWSLIDNTTLLYIVKGTEDFDADESITFSTYRCFYENCIPPLPPTQPPLPTIPPPRPEGRPEVTQSWSNSSIWPGGVKPEAGADVTIPSDMYVLVDEPIPRLGKLIINGGLEFEDTIDHMLEADFVIVDGGRLAIGYPETPFQHLATIMLYGDESSEEIGNQLTEKRQSRFFTNVGAKALAVFGDLFLHGVTRYPTWTTLSATAIAGTDTLQLTDSVTWVKGDLIVVTSTSYDAFETEVFEITDVVNSNTVQLNDTLSYTHSGGYFTSLGEGNRYTTRAEVGLLTRNIVITNNDNTLAYSEAFGCRVVVSQNAAFTAKAQIEGVEFSGCGQLGYTDDFDPRFALAILNIDDSYVRDCSVHDGYNTGIGVFDSNGVSVSGNVVHNTVGASIRTKGSDHSITNNLGSLSQFLGTFRRVDPMFEDWTANFEVTEVNGLTLTGNAAAGGAKVGYHTNGGDCGDSPSNVVSDNTAHSSLHCIHLDYSDGLPAGCSQFSELNLFSCYFFGLFSYSQSGIQLYDSTLTNNKAAFYSSVIGPASLSHQRGTKTVKLEGVLIISAGEEFTCDDEEKRPAIADHETSHSGIVSRSGGHVGVVMPSFVSGGGHYPQFAWFSIISYPAIAGLTEINQVTFANFHQRCEDKLDNVLRTHPGSEDANHPIHLSQITFISDTRFNTSVNSEGKLFLSMPRLGSVNPSDCVDMDCDGYKQMVINDIGGTFTEEGGDRSLISLAEFEWDGDVRRGLGDYRIPKTMLSRPDGSRIPVDDIYPNKGIPRNENCNFNEQWNTYVCAEIEHVMLILESLDQDTEVRRLSPIGIGADSYINLVNGPQDHGWCGGYTCQERISTFFSIVATGLHYTIALTSTNPQDFAMYMLNAREDQAIVSCIIYNNPQRLDVYHNGVYVVPKNAERMADGNLRYLPEDQFDPPQLSDEPGANYYDRTTKQLCITMKGDGSYSIETTPIIVLSLNVQVTVDTFFDEDTIVRNIALLLGIPDNKIRIVSVSRETSRRKRQADSGSEGAEIEFEVGDPPQDTIMPPTEQPGNMTDPGTGMNMTDTGTGNAGNDSDVLTFDELEDLSEILVTAVQTGKIVNALNVTANLTSAAIKEPEPEPVDNTGGVRATPATGGPQPGDFNDTTPPPTFSDIQREEEEIALNTTTESVFSIPTTLQIISEPTNNERIIEGIPLDSYAPQVVMLDGNGGVVVNLGLQTPWVLTIVLVSAPPGAFLTQGSANFTMGQATFSALVFSHPGEYILSYTVTYPATADFGMTSSETITVRPRDLQLTVNQQPLPGNTTFTVYPYPSVSLADSATREVIMNNRWRNSTWFIKATVRTVSEKKEVGRYEEEAMNGQAVFCEIQIETAGEYEILFEAYTEPRAAAELLPSSVTSDPFTIEQLQFAKLDFVYDVDFNSTIEGEEERFIAEFSKRFLAIYPTVEIVNITLTEGSIIVGIVVTAVNPQQLLSLISHATTSSNFMDLLFTFNNMTLVPFNVTRDPAYVVVIPTLPPSILEQHIVVILATVIPGIILIISFLFLLVVCCFVYRHKKQRKSFDMQNKISPMDKEERYITGPRPPSVTGSVDEYFLLSKNNPTDLDAQSLEAHELNSLSSTPASQRKVDVIVTESIDVKVRAKSIKTPETFFSNPGAKLDDDAEEKLEKLDTNLYEQVVDLPTVQL